MTTQQERQQAINWFCNRGIEAWETDEDVYIKVQDYDIIISSSEILYRAELQAEEQTQN